LYQCHSAHSELYSQHFTVEPRFNEPLYNEVLGITNDIFQPSYSVMYGKEPRYNKPISPVPWHFVKSRFHCIKFSKRWVKKQSVMWGLFITFWRLWSAVLLSLQFKRACNSGQCMSAEEKVKKCWRSNMIYALKSYIAFGQKHLFQLCC